MMTEIPLSKTGKKNAGKYTAIVSVIDSDLADFNWKVHVKENGQYAKRKLVQNNGKHTSVLLHRVIMERMLGRPLYAHEQVDHINRNGLDCTRANLRVANSVQNAANRKRNKNNKSNYKGVSWNERDKKWRAQIQVDKKKIHLGSYNTPEEAHLAYCESAAKHFGEFANFGYQYEVQP
jgi:hypothetical protein